MRTEIVKDETYYLEVITIDENGSGKSGLTVQYKVYKSSDGFLIDSGTLTDIGGGLYKKAVTFGNLGQHLVQYLTPSGYEDIIEHVTVVEASDQSIMVEVRDMVKRILGLVHENFRIINPTHDSNGNLISGRIKIYSTATDCENDTNPLAEYEIEATWDSKRLNSGYKVKKL